MATLKTNTLTGTSTAGSIAVTGEGNSTTTNLQQGLAKNWSQVQGTDTFTLNDSFNVSRLTDETTGTYKINFTNSFANATYCGAGMHNRTSNGICCVGEDPTRGFGTGFATMRCTLDNALTDPSSCRFMFVGDS